MKYISGHQALNLPCSLETCGDWHWGALQWEKLNLKESDGSIFGDYGIEKCSKVPYNDGEYYTANTLRAILDLLIEGKFSVAEGAKNDFICNDKYTNEFFEKVIQLRDLSNWNEIDKFMRKEFTWEWKEFICSTEKSIKK